MPSLLPDFNYDIFISYRHNDNRSGWVTEFVKNLQEELAATIKEPLSVYFDTNPHDGLSELHNVDKSLEGKLKCLIFIPILSQTYCDPKSFAWQHEFCAFNRMALQDRLGRDVKLTNGNVISRILPIRIHDMEADDKAAIEAETKSVLRSIEFIFSSPGVNRPLRAAEDHPSDNQNKTFYRDQMNKVANGVKEIVTALKSSARPVAPPAGEPVSVPKPQKPYLKIVIALVVLLAIGFVIKYGMPGGPDKQSVEQTEATNNSIAVLPFVNMSNDSEQEYFSDGITEQIITNLAHINSLKVIARTSSMKFKKTDKSIAEIGKELGVTHVLEGSIRKSGDRIRVTAQLIKVNDETHVWAQDYDKSLTDIFAIQDEVSMAIASTLQRQLTPLEHEGMKSDRSMNVEAYQHYLKGYHIHIDTYYIKRLKDDFLQSEAELKQAIKLDSNYAVAYAALADLYDTYRNFGVRTPEERKEYESMRDQMADKAMKLKPNNPYVVAVKAYTFGNKSDKTDADIDSTFKYRKRAIAIAPNNVDVCDALSIDYFSVGLYYQSMQWRERTVSLDPAFGNYQSMLGGLYMNLGEFQKAEPVLEKALLLQPEDLSGLYRWTLLKLSKKEFAEADAAIRKIKAINREYNVTLLEALDAALKGDKDKALSLTKDAPMIYCVLGLREEALDELEKRLNFPYLDLKFSPWLKDLRSEPRFRKIEERAKAIYDNNLKKYAGN